MKRKTAIKKLMGRGYSRNQSNAVLSYWRRRLRNCTNAEAVESERLYMYITKCYVKFEYVEGVSK